MNQLSRLPELPKRRSSPKKDAFVEYLLIGICLALTIVWMVS